MVASDTLSLLSGEAEFNLSSACGLYSAMRTGASTIPGAFSPFLSRHPAIQGKNNVDGTYLEQ